MAAPRVRPLAPDDLDAVAAIELEVFTDPWSRRAFSDLLGLGYVRGFVVENAKGALAGYAVCSHVEDEGEILNLATALRSRRKGLGRLLLAAVLDWLAERGTAKVFLEVRRSNPEAIAMYEAAGFATLGVRPNYYRRPTEDAVTMVLEMARRSARK